MKPFSDDTFDSMLLTGSFTLLPASSANTANESPDADASIQSEKIAALHAADLDYEAWAA